MTTATFGDFLRQAGAHIEIAAAISREDTTHPAAAARELRRVITAMTRYLQDRLPPRADQAPSPEDLPPWDHAATDACAALQQAADALADTTTLAEHLGTLPDSGPAPSLAAAATCLHAGRDLLHTHAATTPADLWEPRSDWADVVICAPVLRALGTEIASWARHLAPLAAALAASNQTFPSVRDGFQAATHWLWRAEAAIHSAQATDPATPQDLHVLRAIPAAPGPHRIPPDRSETIAQLCTGITSSAERLRATTYGTATRARWAPSATADTWRWTAQAAGITTHASEQLLRSLAGLSHVDRPQVSRAQLTAAADALVWSLTAWRQVGTAWTDLTTDTQGHNTTAEADISDC